MRHLFTILVALFICSAPVQAQALKALMWNTTNGQVIPTGYGLIFSDSPEFPEVFAQGFETRPLGVVAINEGGINFGTTNAAANTRANLGFSTNLNTLWTATDASAARTNLLLGLPALTNTSNVTMMRALAGSTNTNAPYNGIFDFLNGESNSVSVAISNGIIISIE